MKHKPIIATVIVILLMLLYQGYNVNQKTAVIIDPINDKSGFTSKSTQLLTENGYKVTVVSGGNVTIQYLKNLPENHDIYIFRVHSTCINNRTWIFSGEKYRTESYPLMQLADLVHKAKPSLESSYYFAVSPELIQQYNPDGFKNSIILMMGCEGLSSTDLAEAFCREGASTYVSWDGNVCLEHTDTAFLALLESICIENVSITESLSVVYSKIGNDPVYRSTLKAYPEPH